LRSACLSACFGATVAGAVACVSLSGLTSDAAQGAPDASSRDTSEPDARAPTRVDAAPSHDAVPVRDAGQPHFVQCVENGAFASCNSGVTATMTRPVASGDLLLVVLFYELPANPQGPGRVGMSVEDAVGSTFTELDDVTSSKDGEGLRTFYAYAATAAPTEVIQVSFTPCLPEGNAMYVAEYAGVNAIVAHASAVESSAPPSINGVELTVSTDGGGSLLWAMSASDVGETTFLPGTGFTAHGPDGGADWFASPVYYGLAEDKPSSGAPLQVATWTIQPPSDMFNAAVVLR
jgi:hypothetical protein